MSSPVAARPTSASGAPSAPPSPRRTIPGSRRAIGLVLLAATVVLVGVLSLMVGNQALSPLRVVEVLVDRDDSEAATIVHGLRLPRTALLLLVGLALGGAGALMQGYTRNPLADPGLLGVLAGASLAVVIGISWLGIGMPSQYAWCAIVGAGAAAWIVFRIGSSRGGPNPTTLVLAGAAVSALAAAMVSAIVTSSAQTLDDYRFWSVGSAAGRDLGVFWQVLPFIGAGVVLTAICAPGVNLLQLGDDVAASLGLNPRRQKALGVAAIMFLSGGAVAACGPVGFVGLVVPHVARYLAGVDYRWVLPYSALLGGIILTSADVLGRVVAGGAELQVGIMMAIIGGPCFVLLVRKRKAVTI